MNAYAATVGLPIPLLCLLAAGFAAYLWWGVHRLGSEGIVAHEQAKLAVRFAGPCLAMTLVALAVGLLHVPAR